MKIATCWVLRDESRNTNLDFMFFNQETQSIRFSQHFPALMHVYANTADLMYFSQL